jgi:hypothetical protein
MTDRELLELAAKAAEIEIDHWRDHPMINICEYDRGEYRMWNPLTDDGDALRLAVKLKIDFYIGDDDGEAAYAGFFDVTRNNRQRFEIERFENSDPHIATRRAIVRAAAEIGRNMT